MFELGLFEQGWQYNLVLISVQMCFLATLLIIWGVTLLDRHFDLTMVSHHSHAPKFLQLVYASPFLFQAVGWDDRDVGVTSRLLCFSLYLLCRCAVAGTAVIHRSLLQGIVGCSGWVCPGSGDCFITCSPGAVHGLNFQLYSAGGVLSPLFSSPLPLCGTGKTNFVILTLVSLLSLRVVPGSHTEHIHRVI